LYERLRQMLERVCLVGVVKSDLKLAKAFEYAGLQHENRLLFSVGVVADLFVRFFCPIEVIKGVLIPL